MLSGRDTSRCEQSEADARRVQAHKPAQLHIGGCRSRAPRRTHARGGRPPMPRFGVTDGSGDVMAGSNAVSRPVDHRGRDAPLNGTGSRIQHDNRTGGAGHAPCSRERAGPIPHGCRVKDVECRLCRARCHGADLCKPVFVQGTAGRVCHRDCRKSATRFPAVTDTRSAATKPRSRAPAASTSPASRASIAASTAVSSSAGLGAFATLLHASNLPGSSGALPLSRESAQAPDSSPETALPIAPTSSHKMAGAPVRLPAPPQKLMISPTSSVAAPGSLPGSHSGGCALAHHRPSSLPSTLVTKRSPSPSAATILRTRSLTSAPLPCRSAADSVARYASHTSALVIS